MYKPRTKSFQCEVSVCSSVLSHHNKDLEWRTSKPSVCHSSRSWTGRVIAVRSRTECVIALRQISVTALFYLENSRKIHLQGVRACRPKRREEKSAPARGRETDPWPFGSSVYLSFPLPRPAYVNWASRECCSTWAPQIFLCSVFAGFPLPYLLATAFWTVSYSTYLTQGTQRCIFCH